MAAAAKTVAVTRRRSSRQQRHGATRRRSSRATCSRCCASRSRPKTAERPSRSSSPVPASSSWSRRPRRAKRRSRSAASVLNANKAGTFNLTLKPSGAAKSILQEERQAEGEAGEAHFTPTGGDAKSSTSSVTLKLDQEDRSERRPTANGVPRRRRAPQQVGPPRRRPQQSAASRRAVGRWFAKDPLNTVLIVASLVLTFLFFNLLGQIQPQPSGEQVPLSRVFKLAEEKQIAAATLLDQDARVRRRHQGRAAALRRLPGVRRADLLAGQAS